MQNYIFRSCFAFKVLSNVGRTFNFFNIYNIKVRNKRYLMFGQETFNDISSIHTIMSLKSMKSSLIQFYHYL